MNIPAPIMYAVAIVYATLAIGVSLWIIGRAFDHMTDPCRTADMRSMSPACR